MAQNTKDVDVLRKDNFWKFTSPIESSKGTMEVTEEGTEMTGLGRRMDSNITVLPQRDWKRKRWETWTWIVMKGEERYGCRHMWEEFVSWQDNGRGMKNDNVVRREIEVIGKEGWWYSNGEIEHHLNSSFTRFSALSTSWNTLFYSQRITYSGVIEDYKLVSIQTLHSVYLPLDKLLTNSVQTCVNLFYLLLSQCWKSWKLQRKWNSPPILTRGESTAAATPWHLHVVKAPTATYA